MRQMFSFFTYVPQYVLFLFQFKQALAFDQRVDVCLEHEYLKMRKNQPDATEEQLYTQLLKHRLPHDLPGSPAYFKNS